MQLLLEHFRDRPATAVSPEVRDLRLTPPSSPSLSRRRQVQEPDNSNVFMRLTNTSTTQTSTKKSNRSGAINSCEKVCFLHRLHALRSLPLVLKFFHVLINKCLDCCYFCFVCRSVYTLQYANFNLILFVGCCKLLIMFMDSGRTDHWTKIETIWFCSTPYSCFSAMIFFYRTFSRAIWYMYV